MNEVVDLEDRRAPSNFRCAQCGGEWFETKGICLDKTGRITGFTVPMMCIDCHHETRGPIT